YWPPGRPARLRQRSVAPGRATARSGLRAEPPPSPPVFYVQTQLIPPFQRSASRPGGGRSRRPGRPADSRGEISPGPLPFGTPARRPRDKFSTQKGVPVENLSSKEYHRNAVFSSRIVRPSSPGDADLRIISRVLSQFFRRFWGMRSESAIFFGQPPGCGRLRRAGGTPGSGCTGPP